MLTALRSLVALLLGLVCWVVLGLPALGMAMGVRAPPSLARPGLSEAVPHPVPTENGEEVGLSRRERVGQLIHVHLVGDAIERGYAQGLLVGDRVARIETDMMGEFVRRVPSFWARHLILGLVNWNNRSLVHYFTAEELQEIAAITAGHRQRHDCYLAVSPSYARGLEYHALHDVSQYLIDNPLVHPPQIGCTALAVRGSRAAGGHLLVGRLFDFEGGACFDCDKIVYSIAPAQGHRYLSVSWGGMAGAVTGMNDARLWISINAAATSERRFSGRPTVMMVAEVLRTCATIDQALAVLQRSDTFVADGVLLASGAENRALVVEKGKGTGVMGEREMVDDRLVLTNHFLDPCWAQDQANAGRIRDGTTTIRYARAFELLDATRIQDPGSVLTLLRDHRGLGGSDVGFGNRSTINAWIGAHLVVADLTRGVVWVCEPWHGLGRALAFDVDGPRPDIKALPEDPEDGFVRNHLPAYQELLESARTQLRRGQRTAALALAQQALAINPRSFEVNALAAAASSDAAARLQLLLTAATLQPAYGADRRALDQALAAAGDHHPP